MYVTILVAQDGVEKRQRLYQKTAPAFINKTGSLALAEGAHPTSQQFQSPLRRLVDPFWLQDIPKPNPNSDPWQYQLVLSKKVVVPNQQQETRISPSTDQSIKNISKGNQQLSASRKSQHYPCPLGPLTMKINGYIYQEDMVCTTWLYYIVLLLYMYMYLYARCHACTLRSDRVLDQG